MAPAEGATPLGDHLRALREAAGVSLADMAAATRISERYLAALEHGDEGGLPAPVFVKGFIRAYCAFVGNRGDDAIALYERDRVDQTVARPTRAPLPRRSGWVGHPLVLSGALVLIFGGGLLALRLGTRPLAERTVEPAVAARAPASPAPAAPLPTPVVAPAEPPPVSAGAPAPIAAATPPAPESQRLVVRAVEPTWLRVQTDDGRVVEVLLPAGAQREWTSDKQFVLTIGNAGGIEIVFNGRTLPSLGARGTVIRRLSLPEAPGSGS